MNMLRPSVNQLITKNESSYSLVIGVAKRAREIADELYENGKTLEEKPVKTAIRELAAKFLLCLHSVTVKDRKSVV